MFPIARMYDSEARAREAAAALTAAEISEDWITVITPGPDAAARLESGVASGHVPRAQKSPLARGLQKGRTVLSAAGPMSWGVVIESTLEKFDPVGTDELNPYSDSAGTLFSDILGWRTLSDLDKGPSTVLASSDFAPTSVFPLLTKEGKAMFGGLTSSDFAPTSIFPLLTKDGKAMFGSLTSPDFSISKMFGLPLLSKNSTPLSSTLGMKTLSEQDDSK